MLISTRVVPAELHLLKIPLHKQHETRSAEGQGEHEMVTWQGKHMQNKDKALFKLMKKWKVSMINAINQCNSWGIAQRSILGSQMHVH
jgi:hypothetical protein